MNLESPVVVVASTEGAVAVPLPVVLPVVPILIGSPPPKSMPMAARVEVPVASPVTADARVPRSAAVAVPVTLPA